ncbi:hypothetical protein [Mangrovitalea sediminis]|uniref:hypothetical protein n=1 Tax=Mangrovitalea sediminis TaxID=1982043 RepID=UPI000BE51CF3|nr:hypothetical protein [Mangrovitalea sediminis]
MTKPWFNTTGCTRLEIKKYQSISVQDVVGSVTIDDADAIKSIMQRIEQIPADGSRMVSWGPDVESIDLFFHGDNQPTQKIEVYQGHFKTPSTGFNAGGEVESALYADIEALLFPALKKRVLKIKNLELRFEDFSLAYLGAKHSEPAPVTVSWTTDQFLLKDASGGEALIEIVSGQRPPAPYHFDVGGVGFTLLTYQAEAQERLFPHYFQVIGR